MSVIRVICAVGLFQLSFAMDHQVQPMEYGEQSCYYNCFPYYPPHSPTFIYPDYSIVLNPLELTFNQRIQQLYDKAYSVIDVTSKIPSCMDYVPIFNEYINTYHAVRNLDINEDILGRFALQLEDAIGPRIALFFSVLKYYNQNIMTDDGKRLIYIYRSPLARSLNICDMEISRAMRLLVKDFDKIKRFTDCSVRELALWLYADKKLDIQSEQPVCNDLELKRSFLYDAFKIVIYGVDIDLITSVLKIIDCIKREDNLEAEHDLGYSALEYKTTLVDILLMRPWCVSYSSQKNRIGLLCFFIEKYNKARGSKITPHEDDWRLYEKMKNIHFIVPDQNIAFKEFDQFIKDVNNLKKDTDDNVQDFVEIKYPFNG